MACLAAEPSNVPPVPGYVPQDALHYTILLTGSKAGDEAVWKTADGKVHTFSQFNDRGRGPKVDGVYALNDRGLPVNVEIKGNDYLKKAVEETFTFDGTKSRWKSASEAGEQAGLNGFYASLNGTNEEFAMLVRALLAHDNAISLVPVGETRLDKVRTEEVTIGDRKQKLTLYLVTGLGFEPSTAWFDEDNNFYASPGSWFATVRSGGESVLPHLLDIDQQVARSRAATLAKKLTQTPRGEVAITDVAVFDSINAKMLPHQTVIVSGNRIRSVGPASATTPDANATIIDGQRQDAAAGTLGHARARQLDRRPAQSRQRSHDRTRPRQRRRRTAGAKETDRGGRRDRHAHRAGGDSRRAGPVSGTDKSAGQHPPTKPAPGSANTTTSATSRSRYTAR